MQEQEAIIVGRSVTDYVMSGAKVPEGARIVPCYCCHASVALGSTGQEMLAKAKRAYVFCTPCMEIIANKGKLPIVEIHHSAEMRTQVERNPDVAKRVADLERKLKPED
jgi:hypothetical protein